MSFRPYEPDQQLLLPPSLRDWLPPDHLAWFISETVDQLDLSEILDGYRDGGQGNLPYHPAMMLKILIYAYATGIFSSRRIARQIEENIAFRVLAAENAPDHRTICRFREQHLAAFERLFVQVVQIARDTGLVRAAEDQGLHSARARGQDNASDESESPCNETNGEDASLETRSCEVQTAEARRRATLRMDEARAWLPAVQSSGARESQR